MSPQSFISRGSGLLLKKEKKEGPVEMPFCLLFISVPLVLQGTSFHLTFGIVSQNPEAPT